MNKIIIVFSTNKKNAYVNISRLSYGDKDEKKVI